MNGTIIFFSGNGICLLKLKKNLLSEFYKEVPKSFFHQLEIFVQFSKHCCIFKYNWLRPESIKRLCKERNLIQVIFMKVQKNIRFL